MFKEIFLFEIKYRLKRPATWAYFGILFVFALMISIGGNGPASEKAFQNSPLAIAQLITVISIFGILIASAVMGVPVYRDVEHKTQNYYFSFPIQEKSYILGRFLGSLAILFFISLGFQIGAIIGFAIAPFAGFEDAERFTSLHLWHYIQPTLTISWPNLFFAGCLFFALVAMTKRIMLAYAGGAVLFIFYLISLTLAQDLESRELVNLLDPFANSTISNITRYWTPEEQNSQLVPFSGALLVNRLIWVGVGLIIFLISYFRFDFQKFLANDGGKSKEMEDEKEGLLNTAALTTVPKVKKIFSQKIYWNELFRLSWLELKNITRDNFFRAILIAATIFLFFDGWFGAPIYGTPSLPMTYYMLEAKSNTYVILVFVMIVFLVGEVLHRERSISYDQIFYSLPLPNWVIYGSKFLALAAISFILVNMVMVSGILNQALKGYFQFELGMYMTDLYLFEFPQYLTFVMLAFFVHSLVENKFLGHVITIAIWVFIFGLTLFADADYNLLLYGYSPGYSISDMNGFGHFPKSLLSFRIYWLAFGAILVIFGMLFWKRGTDSGRKARWQAARSRLNSFSVPMLGIFALVWLGMGGYNYYNVSVLNKYRTAKQSRVLAAEYEKKLSKYQYVLQPKITDVKVSMDLFPENRSAKGSGEFVMVNKYDRPIDSLHLNWGSFSSFHVDMTEFSIDGQKPDLVMDEKDFGYQIYKLPKTMQPGDTVLMKMTIEGAYKGFPNEGSGSNLVYNGTFLNNNFFPSFGYDPGGELTSDKYRKKYGLPEKDYSLPDQQDAWGLSNLLFNDDADYITFQGTVSTAPDQIAVMPGYLEKEWEENGRKYYKYVMNDEMDYFFNVSSARYSVHKDLWTGPNGEKVNIEVFHDPKHKFNLDRFVKAVKHSMDYFNQHYGPYQYSQMRILEFPRYQSFAQSFPNTVPYAESFGWVGDFSDPNDLDYCYTVTAHEVAHQWWGHQITPSATRGANQISESMAEYSSLMVMKKEYGADAMQKFLKEELDRYLSSRARESKFEKTLLDNDNQSYVWYQKGGLVLYGLQEYIGENQLNSAFKTFIDSAAFRQRAPFATSNEWYGYIKAVTPDSMQYYLEDNFEKICLYANKVESATYNSQAKNGKHEVKLTVHSEKVYYDGNGKVLDVSTKPSLIEIGIFGPDSKNDKGMVKKNPLLLKKIWIKPGTTELTFTVDEIPEKAGIDPYNKLIDRAPEDNLISVDAE